MRIAGLITEMPSQDAEELLATMLEQMVHEPFHARGAYSVQAAGAYVGWVDHRGQDNQPPMLTRNNRKAVIFAGEHFGNGGHGVQAKCAIDGRSFLQAYERGGVEWVRALNGWFAGVVIDGDRRHIRLFNDRFGLHRIYYTEVADGLAFASEAKALLAIQPESRRFSARGLAEFLALGCVFGEGTLYEGINRMPGGSLWTVQTGRTTAIKRERYFAPSELEAQAALPVAEYYDRLREALRHAVPKYFDGNASAALSLTGGLDSRVIMAFAQGVPGPHRAYTYDGLYRDCFDVRLAREVSKVGGFEHEVLRLERDFLYRFPELAERTVWVTDGAADISVSHELYLSRRARDIAPVRVTGNYGSELFRGVNTFKPLQLSPRVLAHPFRAAVVTAEACFESTRTVHPVSFAAFHELPSNLYGRLAAAQSVLTVRSPFTDNTLIALAYQTPAREHNVTAGWARLIRDCAPGLAAIPTDRHHLGKSSALRSLKRAMNEALFKAEWYYDAGMPGWASRLDRWLATKRRPPFFVGSHKIQHYRLWFRDEFAEYIESLVPDQSAVCDYVDARVYRHMVGLHRTGAANYVREITAVATLALVDRLLVKRQYGRSFGQRAAFVADATSA
jgi:asparagine synthase (glutamine-hydrolysing)